MVEHDMNDHGMQMLTLWRDKKFMETHGECILKTNNSDKYHKMDTGEILKLGKLHKGFIQKCLSVYTSMGISVMTL